MKQKIALVEALLDNGIDAFLDEWDEIHPDVEPTIDDFLDHVREIAYAN